MGGNVLLISQNFYPELGSAANRMKKMFEQLDSKGYHPVIVTTEPSYPNRDLFKTNQYFNDEYLNHLEGKRIHRIKMRFQKQHPNLLFRLLYYIELMLKIRFYLKKAGKFQNIIVSSPNIFLAWGTLFFKVNKKAKYFLEIRDLWPDSFLELKQGKIKYIAPLLKFLEKKMYQQADEIIVNNPYFEKHINQLTDRQKNYIYLPNALSKEERNVVEKLEAFSVIYTGNVGYAQNVDELIEIARLLNQHQIHFTAVIYGVQADKFRKVVKEEHLEYVNLIPPMERQSCLHLISQHHVSLSILQNTNIFMNVMPGKVIDSIGSNTPVISNLGGETYQLINKNEIGFSKKSATPHEIVTYIINLKNDTNRLKSVINNTQKVSESHFNWEKNINKLTRALRGD
ncbi:glycosyltransferase family 4 protein [Staphylococcus canis]|uniref:Glycosyltransferase family 4 protein n=1 Tax=Staphylococcus canis TaxID=2724942 RepID=A0ABS0T9G8_9STAP|nr:glycosyltransferase family 4 protein [Staphylococcus canis]MBI5975390.1 glycosyltransferase family 4 protein [Staphylococcus canis]